MDLDEALADIATNPPVTTGQHSAQRLGALALELIATEDPSPAMRRAARQLLTADPQPAPTPEPAPQHASPNASPNTTHLAASGSIQNAAHRRHK
jgi:hypothetical protein